MPNAGRFEYPKYAIDDIIEPIKKIHETLGSVSKREHVAEALGMSARGGGFGALIGSMGTYESIETGHGDIQVTELGKTLAYETDEALLKEAKTRAISNVELFAEYYKLHKIDVTEEKVKAFLRSKAGVDIAELPRIASEISKLLNKVLPYMNDQAAGQAATPKSATQTPASKIGGEEERVIPAEDGLIEFRYGSTFVRFSAKDAEIAKGTIAQIIDAKKPRIQEEKREPIELTQ